MSSVMLVHPEATVAISALQAINKCSLFQENVTLATCPYRVKSSVTLAIFREFVSGLEGSAVTITDTNFTGLQRLCEEFGFGELSATLSEFRPSTGFQETVDAAARGRIAGLEERAEQHDRDIEALQSELRRLSTDFVRLAGEVFALRSSAALPRPPPPQPIPPSPQPVVPSARSLDSRIISDFPEIFAEFREKRFSLLWRGSRDGFKAKEFHRRCDGRANTLTVILDTEGYIFGGFTPVEWESRMPNRELMEDNSCLKADDSQKSFLFTLKNPYNLPARRFPLKAEWKHEAIRCDASFCPWFFGGIAVRNDCNTRSDSWTNFGTNYINDTGLNGSSFLTNSQSFQVKEIEVFEITD
jgi:hypothetical protein